MFPLAPAAASRPRRLAPFVAVALIAATSGALTAAAVLRATPPPPASPPVVVTVPVAVPAVAAAPALAPRPCIPGREDWISAEPRHGNRIPVTDAIVEDCREQLALVTARDQIRVVLVSADTAHVVELPRLAVPNMIDHFRWDAGIDILAGKGELVVVGQDRDDLSRVIAMVSADGGATWTERYLGTIAPRTMVSDARMRTDGTITWETWPD
jgi:hypothetical protein